MIMPNMRRVWTQLFHYFRTILGLSNRKDSEALETLIDQHDHPLFKDYTDFRSYTTTHARYPKIRILYHPHAHAGKLQAIAELPLLVMIHGLGGCLPQFAPLMGSLVNLAPTFGIELPGHGMSEFAPTTYGAYSFVALTELWRAAIEDVCTRYGHSKVVLVGHSLGCSISAALTSSNSQTRMDITVLGIIAICPRAAPPTREQSMRFKRFLSLPDLILDILRWFDRRGRENSNSVKRIVGEAAGIDVKRLQLRYNQQFRTPVWKRTSMGLLPSYDKANTGHGGMPGRHVWQAVCVPLLCISGEADTVTSPNEVAEIVAFLHSQATKDATPTHGTPRESRSLGALLPRADDEQYGVQPSAADASTKHSSPLKTVVLPAPASHALMYDHATYRTVAGLVEDFLAKHVSSDLSLGWQLQQLTTSGKWDVKNLQKWKRVLPVSGPINDGMFRALKTLREQDEEHTPSVFLAEWRHKIFAVIDISHDSPVYDTKALEEGDIQYHKFPTVSKVPPTVVEVQDFVALVDRLRAEIKSKTSNEASIPAIAVHCHYGYNRTGFFIVCYLIERCGYRVQDAIEEFAQAKPPGIKHDHFIDTLFVRYHVGLRKNSTFN